MRCPTECGHDTGRASIVSAAQDYRDLRGPLSFLHLHLEDEDLELGEVKQFAQGHAAASRSHGFFTQEQQLQAMAHLAEELRLFKNRQGMGFTPSLVCFRNSCLWLLSRDPDALRQTLLRPPPTAFREGSLVLIF